MDIFDSFFGGVICGRRKRPAVCGSDMGIRPSITLEAAAGVTKTISV